MRGKSPYIIATGFTTAYLGDERTLREFAVGDYVTNKITQKGKNTVLYVINDSYDPLNYRQLRIGVNKDENLIRKFEGHCGRPIAEIPDPFECHDSYSGHFTDALLQRLNSLDIHPVFLDSYKAYQDGLYSAFISLTFENYYRIQEMLSDRFNNYTIHNLFRPQCPECLCIDATNILKVIGREVWFECGRCRKEISRDTGDIRGKLSWKLDCAARWNLYGIDMETFSKAHLAETGSVEVSRYISRLFFGGKIPAVVRYGDVKISRELSFKLIEILPPKVFKGLFTSNLTRDVYLSRDYVENYSHKFIIQSGMSYVDYVKRELPKDALLNAAAHQTNHDKSLVMYGNNFSKFYYDKDYRIKLPDLHTVISVPHEIAETAGDIISHALSIRKSTLPEDAVVSDIIKSYLFESKVSADVYRYLRCLLGQEEGPNMTTLLSILPKDYLELVQTILGCYTGEISLNEKTSNVSEGLMTVLSKLEAVYEKNENLSDSDVYYTHPGVSEEGRS